MTKFLRFVFALTVAIALHQSAVSQSLSINTTGAVADPSAILDVTSTLKGMLIPRMDKTAKSLIGTPANGLLVYQTGPDSIGFHYYDLPNTQWVYINTNGFATDSTAWKLTGNSNVVDTSFLGSINNKALKFRVNNTASGIVDSTSGNTGLGYRTLITNTAAGFYANTAMGFGAGQALGGGYANTLMGRHTLSISNGSTQNIAIGDSAMSKGFGVGGNTAVGFQALKQINGLGFYTYNTAIGYASQNGPTGTINGPFSYYNTSVGGYAMADNMAGYDNVAIGVSALRFNDSSSSNTAVGINALAYHKRSGFNSNVAIGSFALENDSIGVWNTVVGSEAMQNAKRGSVNVAIGFRSMRAHKDGGENTAVGVGTLEADSSGTQNTAIGRSALFFNKIAGQNTVLGAEAAAFNNYLQTNPLQGSENTYVGFNSGRTANVGRKNAVLGAYALEGSGIYGDLPTLDAYSRNSVVGDSAALRTFGNDNVAMGFKALNTNAGGSLHVAIGSRALATTTATYPNTAIGYSSMDSTTTGFANTAVGSYSLTDNKAGFNNVAVGNAAMFQSTAGNNNTAVGNDAGRFIRVDQNTAIGSAALRNDSTGTDNVAAGYQASLLNDTASQTTAVGKDALYYNKTDDMVAVGYQAGLYSGFTGPTYFSKEHTSVGTQAGYSNFDGDKITALGYRAYYNRDGGTVWANTVGRNTAIGDSAMGLTYGAYNVAVGTEALSRARASYRNVAIGDSSMGNALNVIDNVGVGYKTLSQVLNQGNTAMGTYAGQKLANTIWNTAIGYHALETDTTGSENTVIGTSAFRSNANGIRNASLGINTGYWIKGSNNTFLGSYAGEGSSTGSTTATSNTAVGFVALRNIRSGNQNTALGEYALSSDTSGSLNVSVGAGSMESHLRGDDNVAMGFWAGRQDSAATGAVYIGRDAGYSNQRDYTVAIGYQALLNNTLGATLSNEGNGNTAVGKQAMMGNTLGELNTALGFESLRSNTTGDYNTAVGYRALFSSNSSLNTAIGTNNLQNNTGGSNTAIGSVVMQGAVTGSNNVGIGPYALNAATGANNNIAIGQAALNQNNTGDNNVAVGESAGYANISGGNNTLLGYNADVTLGNLTNATAVGAFATVSASNSLVLGSGANVGIGTSSPGKKLHVFAGTSGATFNAGSQILMEDDASSYLEMSTPLASENGILSSNNFGAGGIRSALIFRADSSMQLRSGGNNTTMTLDNDNLVGIGTTVPTQKLDVIAPTAIRNAGMFQSSNALSHFSNGATVYANNTYSATNIDVAAVKGTVLGTNRGYGVGGYFQGGYVGLWANVDNTNPGSGTRSTWGVYSLSQQTTTATNYGVYGFASGAAASNYGTYGAAISAATTNYGVYGTASGATTNWGGYFAGNVFTSGTYTPSDAVLKSNIRNYDASALLKIMSLQTMAYSYDIAKYKYMNLPAGDQFGFLAQDLEKVFPQLVTRAVQPAEFENGDRNGKKLNEEIQFKAVNYTGLIPVLTKAVQEQQEVIEKQQKAIDDLLKRVQKLEQK